MESVAVIVIGKLPVCVGVPESVAPESVRPDGSAPVTVKLMIPMPPLCVKVWVYGELVVPVEIVVGSTVMVEQLIVSE